MSRKYIDNVKIENAHIFYRNFSGRETKFNPPGRRNFCVFIDDPEIAEKMHEDGFRIKLTKPRPEEGLEPRPYLQVAVSFDKYPPNILLVTSRGKTKIGEEEVHQLDLVEIVDCKLIINPYTWEYGGNSGVKAYLKSMAVVINEDPFEAEYEDIPFLNND